MGSEEVEHLELPLSEFCVVCIVDALPSTESHPHTEKHKKEETEEMILRKTERNRKRRLQAIKRREKHKVLVWQLSVDVDCVLHCSAQAETVHKLLHKQTTKKPEEDKVS